MPIDRWLVDEEITIFSLRRDTVPQFLRYIERQKKFFKRSFAN